MEVFRLPSDGPMFGLALLLLRFCRLFLTRVEDAGAGVHFTGVPLTCVMLICFNYVLACSGCILPPPIKLWLDELASPTCKCPPLPWYFDSKRASMPGEIAEPSRLRRRRSAPTGVKSVLDGSCSMLLLTFVCLC